MLRSDNPKDSQPCRRFAANQKQEETKNSKDNRPNHNFGTNIPNSFASSIPPTTSDTNKYTWENTYTTLKPLLPPIPNQTPEDMVRNNPVTLVDRLGLNGENYKIETFKVSPETPINFNDLVSRSAQLSQNELPEKYRDGKYQYKTVDEYKTKKQYPQGNDSRSDGFNGCDLSNSGAHGTNLEVVLKAILNTNMQLVPSIKQVKLQGVGPSAGESNGTTLLNRKYVSTIGLMKDDIDIGILKDYAGNSAGSWNKSKTKESQVPVIVIGDGTEYSDISSSVPNEVGFKRLNIRLIALQNEKDMEHATGWLNEIKKIPDYSEVGSIKIVTYETLEGAVIKSSIPMTDDGDCNWAMETTSLDIKRFWNCNAKDG